MKERLQKILSARGVCSRREAERMIIAGRVAVDGVAATLGDSADTDFQSVSVDGVPLPQVNDMVYIMLNKPKGYLTSMSDDRGRRTVAELVAACPVRVYPVGRLDYDSEGLLLMTNDGEFANAVMHPSGGVRKIYRAYVSGSIKSALPLLRGEIDIDGCTVTALGVAVLSDNGRGGALEITIGEGRNRQVRKMCAKCGLTVTELTRIAEGELTLGSLKIGEWRYLTPDELKKLKKCN